MHKITHKELIEWLKLRSTNGTFRNTFKRWRIKDNLWWDSPVSEYKIHFSSSDTGSSICETYSNLSLEINGDILIIGDVFAIDCSPTPDNKY